MVRQEVATGFSWQGAHLGPREVGGEAATLHVWVELLATPCRLGRLVVRDERPLGPPFRGAPERANSNVTKVSFVGKVTAAMTAAARAASLHPR